MRPKPLLPESEVRALMRAEHGDPFAVLGPHETREGLLVRALMPGAQSVAVMHSRTGWPLAMLTRQEDSDVFSGLVPAAEARLGYSFQVDWGTHSSRLQDPYRFPFVLGDTDVWLLAEGTHLRPWERLGAHLREMDGVKGVAFAVWAPNARRVSVVGDFNNWDGRRHMMRLRRECGVWEIFAPHVATGDAYEFEILSSQGDVLRKADPFAFSSQLRPDTACVVAPLPAPVAMPEGRAQANERHAPISIYEVHLGSWRRKNGHEWLDYRELADTLVPYVRDMGFTHIELLPISEHPVRRLVGLPADRAVCADLALRHAGRLPAFRGGRTCGGAGRDPRLGARALPHRRAWAGRFDGTALYEYADPREGFHNDWQTLIFNYARTEVRNYLVGNALYWLERYGVDGLRVDAVASMLYRDYSRKAGEWIPNVIGGRENLEAIDFLRRMNHVVGVGAARCRHAGRRVDEFPGRDTAARRRRAGLSLQVEHGLDERHAGVCGHRPGVPQAPSPADHLRADVRAHRELRAAAVARRGGARQGLDDRAHAGRRVAEVRGAAQPVRLPLGLSGQEAAVHGRRVRPVRGVERGPWARLAPAGTRAAPGRSAAGARPEQRVPALSRAARAGQRGCGFRVDRARRRGSVGVRLCPPRARRVVRGGGVQFHAAAAAWVSARGSRAGAYREIINTDGAVYGGSGVGNGVVESALCPGMGRRIRFPSACRRWRL
jgi:hypothetical protein